MRARRRCGGGFTLVEVVIAVGITAATVLTVFSLLVPARDGSREAALVAAAVRMQPGLERDLGDRGMDAVFEKVADGKTGYYGMYQVRVRPGSASAVPAEDDLVASAEGVLGDGFTLATVVRDLADAGERAEAEVDMGALEGVLFVVRLGSEIGEEVQAEEPTGGAANYPAAVLVVSAEFVEVPVGVPVADWEERARLRRPVLAVPLAVRR